MTTELFDLHYHPKVRELLDSMQAGTLDPEVSFLNASLVSNVFPILTAAHKALQSKGRDSITTRTVHSELVYNYSGSKHITESLKRCGISENSTYILAARFNASSDECLILSLFQSIGFNRKFFASLELVKRDSGGGWRQLRRRELAFVDLCLGEALGSEKSRQIAS
ncbi:uncharacterized protein LOC141637875 [Silene latifolia]|uniref:uncharacterized protein LOC141637875 n=1 Tax=Silene latifolia TaxID=37657 RepID=UPI003D779BB2